MAISASQIVDKTENAKDNELKISVVPPESLKSRKTFFSDKHCHILLPKCESHASFRYFYRRTNALISIKNSKNVKIRMWSKNLGTTLLRNTEFMEVPWRPKILSRKS